MVTLKQVTEKYGSTHTIKKVDTTSMEVSLESLSDDESICYGDGKTYYWRLTEISNKISPTVDLDELADKHLMSLMKEHPDKVLMWAVIKAGQLMDEANAATMKLKTESTLQSGRYEITANFKIKKITDLWG